MEEEIQKFLEKGMSYNWILNYFERKGIIISYRYIMEIQIIKLRQQRKTYKEIVEDLQKYGIKISTDKVRRICQNPRKEDIKEIEIIEKNKEKNDNDLQR